MKIINDLVKDPIAEILGSWSVNVGWEAVLFRIILSVALAAIVGCERSSKRHSAGLRTFILISLASAVSAMIDLCINAQISVISAAAVVSIAMISGNSILFSSKSQIKGLTTSAGLWACGIIGLTAGAGLYTITFTAFIALLFCLSLLPRVERLLKDRSNHFEIHLELKSNDSLQDFVTTIRKLNLKIDDIELNPAYVNSGLSVYSISITISKRDFEKYKHHRDIIEALGSLEYVYHIEEMI